MGMYGGGSWLYPLGFDDEVVCSRAIPRPFPRRSNESDHHWKLKRTLGSLALEAGWRVGFEVSSPGGGIADVVVCNGDRAAALEAVCSTWGRWPPNLNKGFPTFWFVHQKSKVQIDGERVFRAENLRHTVFRCLETVLPFEMPLPKPWDLVCNQHLVIGAIHRAIDARAENRILRALQGAVHDAKYGERIAECVWSCLDRPEDAAEFGIDIDVIRAARERWITESQIEIAKAFPAPEGNRQ